MIVKDFIRKEFITSNDQSMMIEKNSEGNITILVDMWEIVLTSKEFEGFIKICNEINEYKLFDVEFGS